ncbi:unnamed protein product, partial [marine sediment metagenome]
GDSIESRFENNEAIEILSKVKGNFAQSLVVQYKKRGLSNAQWYWAHKLAHDNNDHQITNFKLDCDLESWLREAGVPKIMWRLDGKARVKLYVNENDISVVYSGGDLAKRVGRIKGDTLFPTKNCPQAAIAQILVLAKMKMEFLTLFGKESGVCCVCGRELENEESVKAGIGPICAGRFG